MKENKKFFAFISYQRKDESWAKWLANEIENFHLPISILEKEDYPKNLRPVFRDIDELSAGNLPQQIEEALNNSKNLIVVCSPNAAKSKWVNKEVESFIKQNKTERIFPFIVDGEPMSQNYERECYPPVLKDLPPSQERIGGNINEKGRDAALIKIIAGMLDISFDSLWNRYERQKAEEERKLKEQRDNLLILQSRFLSKVAREQFLLGKIDTSALILLEALPKNLTDPERPYVEEALDVLKEIYPWLSSIIRLPSHTSLSTIGGRAVSILEGYRLKIWNCYGDTNITLLSLGNKLEKFFPSKKFDNSSFTRVFIPEGKDWNVMAITEYENIYLLETDTQELRLVNSLPENYRLKNIKFTPDQKLLAVETIIENTYPPSCRLYLYSLNDLMVKKELDFDVEISYSFSDDNNLLAVAYYNEIILYNLKDLKVNFKISEESLINSCCFLNKESLIYSIDEKEVKILNVDQKQTKEVNIDISLNRNISDIIAKDNIIVILTLFNDLVIFDLNSRQVIRRKKWPCPVSLKNLVVDENKVLFGYNDTLLEWDYTYKGYDRKILYYHYFLISCFSLSIDSRYIISYSFDNIKIWSIEERIIKYDFKVDFKIRKINVSPDLKFIFFGNNDGLWRMNISTLQIKCISREEPLDILVTGDSKFVLSGFNDYIAIYDIYKLELYHLQEIQEGDNPILFKDINNNDLENYVEWDVNAGKFIIIDQDNSHKNYFAEDSFMVQKFSISDDTLIENARKLLENKDLTSAEKRNFYIE